MTDGAGKGRVFTQDEVNAILTRAVERQHSSSGDLSYEELIDVARQAGIAREAIEAAVRDVGGGGGIAAKAPAAAPAVGDDEVRTELAARAWKARRTFAIHFTVFAMVNTLLAFANWETWRESNHTLWFVYPVLAWGILLATHFTMLAYGHFLPDPRAEERARKQLGKRANRASRASRDSRDERDNRDERERRGQRIATPGERIEPNVRVGGERDEPDDVASDVSPRATRTRRT